MSPFLGETNIGGGGYGKKNKDFSLIYNLKILMDKKMGIRKNTHKEIIYQNRIKFIGLNEAQTIRKIHKILGGKNNV